MDARTVLYVDKMGGEGDCSEDDITYTISCMEECGKRDLYRGESIMLIRVVLYRTF